MGLLNTAANIYSADRQQSAADDAAAMQAEGVRNAQNISQEATNRARMALGGPSATPLATMGPAQNWDPLTPTSMTTTASSGVDPRADYLQGIQSGLQFTNQGYSQAGDTISPLAAMAQPYLDEQYALTGMSGDQAQQEALGRVSNPLIAEQERALIRNNSALGGVGGNVLSALASQARNQTEANIGNRLAQLSNASAPALSALQQQSNLQLNQGLNMADILRSGGAGLADMETNRRRALANIEIGQGAEMSQLAQNLGTASGGGAAYRAQNAPAISQGINSATNSLMSMMGSFGGV